MGTVRKPRNQVPSFFGGLFIRQPPLEAGGEHSKLSMLIRMLEIDVPHITMASKSMNNDIYQGLRAERPYSVIRCLGLAGHVGP